MTPNDITKDADRLLRTAYRIYKDRLSGGASADDALDAISISAICQQDKKLDEVRASRAVYALRDKQLVTVAGGDDKATAIWLTDDGICYMEQRAGNLWRKLRTAIGDIISAVISLLGFLG